MNTGNYLVFNETSPAITRDTVGSGSIPFVFNNMKLSDGGLHDYVCMDGGTVYNTNIVTAVERCREQVDDDS